MLKPKRYIQTRIINIEQDPYSTKARDPYYRQQRANKLFQVVMVIAVALLVFWLSIKLSA
jgi:hypothetical protein